MRCDEGQALTLILGSGAPRDERGQAQQHARGGGEPQLRHDRVATDPVRQSAPEGNCQTTTWQHSL